MATAGVAIETHDLTRRFGRGHPALDGVSVAWPAGAVAGVVGPNGAGKSTLLAVLATLVAPSSGHAAVFGLDVTRDGRAVRRSIGFAPRSDAAHYGRLSIRDNLRLFASLHGLTAAAAHDRIGHLLDRFGVRDEADRPLQACSTGMRQRANLMRALLHEPPVLLLDEPLVGLDADGARALAEVLDAEWRGRPGRAVVAAAPRAEDLGLRCDHVVTLRDGRRAG